MLVPHNTNPTGVRFPPEIKDFFKDMARRHGRSFNSEIIQTLKEKMDKENSGDVQK